jgi:hypothetical protein
MSAVPARELVTKSFVTESCPRCNGILRQEERFAFERHAYKVAESVSAVSEWLESGCPELGLSFEVVKGDEGLGTYRWRVTGKMLEVEGRACVLHLAVEKANPNFVSVSLVTAEAGDLGTDFFNHLPLVVQDHGLQPTAGRHSGTNFIESHHFTEWGAVLYLSAGRLPAPLLRPVTRRLVLAMQELIRARAKFAPPLES